MILDRARPWTHMIDRVVRSRDSAKAPEAMPALTSNEGKTTLRVVEEIERLDVLLGNCDVSTMMPGISCGSRTSKAVPCTERSRILIQPLRSRVRSLLEITR